MRSRRCVGRLRTCAKTGDGQACLTQAQDLIDFYQRETHVHFHEEKEVVFPKLFGASPEPPDALVRVLIQHIGTHTTSPVRDERSLPDG